MYGRPSVAAPAEEPPILNEESAAQTGADTEVRLYIDLQAVVKNGRLFFYAPFGGCDIVQSGVRGAHVFAKENV